MTEVDVVSLIGGVIAVLAVVAPILVSKYSQLANALSIIQSFLDLLQTYGKAIADGTITEVEYTEIGKEFVTVAKVTSLDKTIQAKIPGLEQDMIDSAVNITKIAGTLIENRK